MRAKEGAHRVTVIAMDIATPSCAIKALQKNTLCTINENATHTGRDASASQAVQSVTVNPLQAFQQGSWVYGFGGSRSTEAGIEKLPPDCLLLTCSCGKLGAFATVTYPPFINE